MVTDNLPITDATFQLHTCTFNFVKIELSLKISNIYAGPNVSIIERLHCNGGASQLDGIKFTTVSCFVLLGFTYKCADT